MSTGLRDDVADYVTVVVGEAEVARDLFPLETSVHPTEACAIDKSLNLWFREKSPKDVVDRFISLGFYANGVKSQSPGSRGFASAPWVEYANKIFTPTALYRTFETSEPIKQHLM